MGFWKTFQPKTLREDTPTPAADRKKVRRAFQPAVDGTLEARQLLTTLPSGFNETTVAGQLDQPTRMALAPDGRIFVAQQAGTVQVIQNGQKAPNPFLTVSTVAKNWGGLVGMTLDPNFSQNNYLYVFYTTKDSNGAVGRVSRFTAGTTQAEPGSEKILLEIRGLKSNSKKAPVGGALQFGNDGKLYIGVGDAGHKNKAKSLNSQFGKVLRINPDGTIPTDNPFVSNKNANAQTVWAAGLHDPIAVINDAKSGQIYINDEGRPKAQVIAAGVSKGYYGWPNKIKSSKTFQITSPLATVPSGKKATVARQLSGGAFYRPTTATFPAGLVGDFFFADAKNDAIRVLDGATTQVANFATNTADTPVDIQVANDGSLLYLARGNSSMSGTLNSIQFTVSDAPTVLLDPKNVTVAVGQPATFSAAISGKEPLTFQWQKNGEAIPGQTSSTLVLNSVATTDNNTTYQLVATNANGTVTTNPATLTVTNEAPPSATILAPAVGTAARAGQSLAFSGYGQDNNGKNLPVSSLNWRVDLINPGGSVSPILLSEPGVKNGSFVVPPGAVAGATVRVYLTVSASSGLSQTTYRELTVS